MPHSIIAALLLCMSMACVCCSHRSEHHPALDAADSLIESRPDSALAILSAINPAQLHSRPLAARYAVLMSMALDKNYIDTADFTVIQPAIDYYLTHGTPDERLRTLYYMGRIYQNSGNDDMAMSSFMDGAELRDEVSDTLVLARLYVMQGVLYSAQYRLGSATDKYLQAANLYRFQRPELMLDCYLKAFHNSALKEDKDRADSIYSICSIMVKSYPEYNDSFDSKRLSYAIDFGKDEEIKQILDSISDIEISDWLKFTVARAYVRLGQGNKAIDYINQLNIADNELNPTQYYEIKAQALELINDFKGANAAYKLYVDSLGVEMARLLNSSLPFSGQKHEIKLKHLDEIHRGERNFLISVIVACLLALCVMAIYYLFYRTRTRKVISEQRNLNLQLQIETQEREKEKLRLENRSSELELENLRLQNEASQLTISNLNLEKKRLENESESLRELLCERTHIDEAIRSIIRDRLSLLNSIIAKDITKNESYGQPYINFLEKVKKDKVEFLNSTRAAFSASHPNFIKYLEQCGLSDTEINCCCLYAIGMRGKEVAEYTQYKRLYNMSSTIRKKLGLGEHDTNLNLYIISLLEGK
ncbi:MAG: hypothetical protein HDS78_06460 [Bacteroidales bacterium]|nr:hypothetical protein [Bacteroidales bacterium]